jgi:hypothetical protein
MAPFVLGSQQSRDQHVTPGQKDTTQPDRKGTAQAGLLGCPEPVHQGPHDTQRLVRPAAGLEPEQGGAEVAPGQILSVSGEKVFVQQFMDGIGAGVWKGLRWHSGLLDCQASCRRVGLFTGQFQ